MPRMILGEANIHPAVRDKIAGYRTDLISEVKAAVAVNEIVIVGMRQNPAPRKARRLLDAAGIKYTYLEYGSYFSEWRRRLAEDVDRLADVSHGVREGRAGRRGGRPEAAARQRRGQGKSVVAHFERALDAHCILVAQRFVLGHQPAAHPPRARIVGVFPLPHPQFDHSG